MHPRELDVLLHEARLAGGDGERAEEPAVLQAALDHVGGRHGVLEKERLRPAQELAGALPGDDLVGAIAGPQRNSVRWEQTIGEKATALFEFFQDARDSGCLPFQRVNPV